MWLQGLDRGEWSHTTGIPYQQRALKAHAQRALLYPSRGGLGVSPSARCWMHKEYFFFWSEWSMLALGNAPPHRFSVMPFAYMDDV